MNEEQQPRDPEYATATEATEATTRRKVEKTPPDLTAGEYP